MIMGGVEYMLIKGRGGIHKEGCIAMNGRGSNIWKGV